MTNFLLPLTDARRIFQTDSVHVGALKQLVHLKRVSFSPGRLARFPERCHVETLHVSLWVFLLTLPQSVPLPQQVSDGRTYGGRLRVGGLLLQVEAEVSGAAGQQAVWTVARATGAKQPLAGQRQVLVPVWRVA